MTEPTNEELAEALRSIEGLPLGTRLVVRLAADRLIPPVQVADDDGWIEWGGLEYPTIFEPGQIVETRHRDGEECTGSKAWTWNCWHDGPGFWVHGGTHTDIVAYRVVK